VERILYGINGRSRKKGNKGVGREERREEKNEKKMELEEVKGAIGRLKDEKALGMDGIPNKV